MTKPIAYVINLDRRKDRWQRTQQLWSPFFELVRCSAVDLPDGARGCKLSHCQYAAGALARDTIAIILEDDAIPTPEMGALGMAYIAEAHWHNNGTVNDWDAINLSPLLDLSAIGLPRAELFLTESPLFLRCSYSHSTNMVLYNHRSLPILRDSLTSQLPVDMFLTRNCSSQWTPRRLLATQSFEDSDIRKPFKDQHSWYAKSAEMLEAYETAPIPHPSS